MNVFIVGLRRSGTTIFWETLRQDNRFICYDEPFNPHLEELPAQNVKKTRDEFIRLYEQDTTNFQDKYVPISFKQEIQPDLTRSHVEYLHYLIQQNEHNIIDFTRCNFKVKALLKIDPDAKIIHIIRDPAGFISSHLGCQYSKGGRIRKLKNYIRRRFFWHFRSYFDGYGLETIFNELMSGEGVVCEGFRSKYNQKMPVTSVEKLLCLWKYSMDYVEDFGEKSGKNYLRIYTPDFLVNPEKILSELYSKLGFPIIKFDLRRIHAPRTPLFPNHPRWEHLADKYDIDLSYFHI